MRTSEVFVLGAIMGAAVVWLWGKDIEEYVQEGTRGVRTTAADGVRAVEEKAGKVLDRGGDALRVRRRHVPRHAARHVPGRGRWVRLGRSGRDVVGHGWLPWVCGLADAARG